MKRIIKLLYEYKGTYILGIMGSLVSIGISFLIPWANKYLIDEVLMNRKVYLLRYVFAFYLIAAFVNVTLDILLPRLFTFINERVSLDLRMKLMRNIQYFYQAATHGMDKGEGITIFNNDIPGIAMLLTKTLKDLIGQTILLGTTLCLLAFMDYKLAFISLATIPIYAFLPLVFRNKIRYITKETQSKVSQSNNVIQECLNGIYQTQIFNAQEWMLAMCKRFFSAVIPSKLQQVTWQRVSTSTLVVYWVSIIAVFWTGGNMVVSGRITIGFLLVMVNYIGQIEWPVRRIVEAITEIHTGIISLERYENYLKKTTNNSVPEKEKYLPLKNVDSVQLQNVSFSYQHDICVLDGVTLHVSKGEKIALIGPSGAGKTTLVNLLLGFHVPDRGSIELNGQNMNHFSVRGIRDKICYMSQESYIFHTTVKENILLGMDGGEDIPNQDIEAAAKRANAHEFITRLPDKYGTIIGENGVGLSTGQKQRIALARIFLRNPDVIILDEPTSNLDNESGSLIMESLMTIASSKTIILITHKLKDIEGFDKVFILDKGNLKLSGR